MHGSNITIWMATSDNMCIFIYGCWIMNAILLLNYITFKLRKYSKRTGIICVSIQQILQAVSSNSHLRTSSWLRRFVIAAVWGLEIKRPQVLWMSETFVVTACLRWLFFESEREPSQVGTLVETESLSWIA
jgi:hypothetical protein